MLGATTIRFQHIVEVSVTDLGTFLGIASGAVTLLVFATGRPSILHFLPIQGGAFHKFIPSPAARWKFLVKDSTLYLRAGSREIPVLPELESVEDYRIRVSPGRSRYLIICREKYSKVFESLLVINADGTKLRSHRYPSGVVDGLWIAQNEYLVFLRPPRITDERYSNTTSQYPYEWHRLDPKAVGEYSWDITIKQGNYLVTVDEGNEIAAVSRY